MSGYKTTYIRDVFTKQEQKDGEVTRATRWLTGRHNKQGNSLPDGYVPIHSTWEYHPAPAVRAIKYHRTEILRIDSLKGIITIDNGGWDTPFTKQHINEFLPWGNVWSKAGQKWFSSGTFSIPFDEQVKISFEQSAFFNEHLPYGKIEGNVFILDGLELKWSEITSFPDNQSEMKLKMMYGSK